MRHNAPRAPRIPRNQIMLRDMFGAECRGSGQRDRQACRYSSVREISKFIITPR
jgi:hypothetical protein